MVPQPTGFPVPERLAAYSADRGEWLAALPDVVAGLARTVVADRRSAVRAGRRVRVGRAGRQRDRRRRRAQGGLDARRGPRRGGRAAGLGRAGRRPAARRRRRGRDVRAAARAGRARHAAVRSRRSGAGRGARRAAAPALGRSRCRAPVPPAARDVRRVDRGGPARARPPRSRPGPRRARALRRPAPRRDSARCCWPRTCTRRTCSRPSGSRGSSSTRSPTSAIRPTTSCSTCSTTARQLLADPRGFARRMAELTGVDGDRVIAWLFARCVVEAAWWPDDLVPIATALRP